MGDWSGSEQERFEELKVQAKHHLARGRAVKLEDEADYYRMKSTDKSVSAKDREVFKLLADQLDNRLGRNAPPSEQIQLW